VVVLESLVIAITFSVGGFLLGRRSCGLGRERPEKAAAYRELLDALFTAVGALTDASLAEIVKDNLPENTKEAVRSTLKSVSRVLEMNRFLYSEDVCEALDGALKSQLEMEWAERVEILMTARRAVLNAARKDMGTN
jgi:c-di-GMP-related signal transduction protein